MPGTLYFYGPKSILSINSFLYFFHRVGYSRLCLYMTSDFVNISILKVRCISVGPETWYKSQIVKLPIRQLLPHSVTHKGIQTCKATCSYISSIQIHKFGWKSIWRLWDRASLEQRCKQPTRCNKFLLLIILNQLYMFRATNSSILRTTFWLYIELLVQCTEIAADRWQVWDGVPSQTCHRSPVGINIGALYQKLYIQSKSAPEDGRVCRPKHVEVRSIFTKMVFMYKVDLTLK